MNEQVCGFDTRDEAHIWEIRQHVGMVFQNPDNQIVAAVVEEDVAFGPENLGIPSAEIRKRVDAALEAVNMTEYREHGPHLLSGGQKQRVAIAGILAIGPKLIILDESTSMLDPAGKFKILKLIRKLQKENELTIFSITHDINEAEHADQILVLDKGSLLASDSPVDIFKDVSLIKNAGLDLPLFYKIKNKLINEGIGIPQEVNTEEKLVKYLCQLNSKM